MTELADRLAASIAETGQGTTLFFFYRLDWPVLPRLRRLPAGFLPARHGIQVAGYQRRWRPDAGLPHARADNGIATALGWRRAPLRGLGAASFSLGRSRSIEPGACSRNPSR